MTPILNRSDATAQKDRAETVFWAALALYVVVLPIAGTTALRSLAFVVLAGVTVWQATRGRLHLHFPLAVPWALYALVSFASLAYAMRPEYSLGELKAEVGYDILIFLIGASWIRDAGRLNRLLWLLVAANLLFVSGSLWNAIEQGDAHVGAWRTGIGATATVIVTVGPWVAARAAAAFGAGRTAAFAALAALCFANLGSLTLTMNRQGWISLLAAFAVVVALTPRRAWTRRRTALAAVLGVLFVMGLFNQLHLRSPLQLQTQQQTTSEPGSQRPVAATSYGEVFSKDLRWQLWNFSLARIADRPWSGGGFGRDVFEFLFPDYRPEVREIRHAHNMVLDKGIQMGLPGIAAFLLLWAAAARACARGIRLPEFRLWAIAALAMLAGVFTRNMVDDFFIRDHSLMFWLLLGSLLGAMRQATADAAVAAEAEPKAVAAPK